MKASLGAGHKPINALQWQVGLLDDINPGLEHGAPYTNRNNRISTGRRRDIRLQRIKRPIKPIA
jgi:hypothetical protein